MPGRHAAADARPRRRGRSLVILAVVLALLVVPTAGYFGIRKFGPAAADQDASCQGFLRIHVSAAPEIAGPLKSVAERIDQAKVSVDGACVAFDVSAESPRDVFTRLSGGDTTDIPDLWVPDTWEWVSRTGIAQDRLLSLSPSVASSPLVLATSQSNADKLGKNADNWSTLATAGNMALADAEKSGAALSALLGIRRSLSGTPEEARSKLGTILLRLNKDRVDDLDVELDQAHRDTGLRHGVPATEQQVLSYTKENAGADVVPVAPKNGTVLLDYPMVAVVQDKPRAPRIIEAGAALMRYVDDAKGRAVFRRAGFRDYRDLAPASQGEGVGEVKTLPPVTLQDADDVLRSWAAMSLESRLLAVVDVSGSMAAAAGSRNRIELARDAAGTAFSYFPDKGEVGLWAFSENRDGNRDYVQLSPTGALTPKHRGELRSALDELPDQIRGGTGLYDTFLAAYRTAQSGYDSSRVNSLVLLTDGRDEDSVGISMNQLISTLKTEADAARPIAVILVGIGPEADLAALEQIADTTGGRAYRAKNATDMEDIIIDALLRRQCGSACS